VVQSRLLQWDNAPVAVTQKADVIIAGDVVYAEQAHEALLSVMRQHLNPIDGIVLCVNSRRNGSMDRFVMTAKASFSEVDVRNHFDADVSRMLGKMKCDPVLTVLRVNNSVCGLAPSESVMERLEKISEERAAKQAIELSAAKKATREEKGRQKLTDELYARYKQRKEAQLAHDRSAPHMAEERPASAIARGRTGESGSSARHVRPWSADAFKDVDYIKATAERKIGRHLDRSRAEPNGGQVLRKENRPRKAVPVAVPHAQLYFDSVPKSTPTIMWAQRPIANPWEHGCEMTSPVHTSRCRVPPGQATKDDHRSTTARKGDRASLAAILHGPGFSHRLRSLGVLGSDRMRTAPHTGVFLV
jgi:hypothetical protein